MPWDCLCNCAPPFLLIIIGLIVGRAREAAHFKSLKRREALLNKKLTVTNLKRLPVGLKAEATCLCAQNVVIASDFFKTFVAGLKKLIGGNIGSYETLLVRARREALARVMEEASSKGVDILINVRFETSMIGRKEGDKGAPNVEILCYGTAVTLAEDLDTEGLIDLEG